MDVRKYTTFGTLHFIWLIEAAAIWFPISLAENVLAWEATGFLEMLQGGSGIGLFFMCLWCFGTIIRRNLMPTNGVSEEDR